MRFVVFLIALSAAAQAQQPPQTEYQYDRLHETPLYQSQIDEDAARDAQHRSAEDSYLRSDQPMGSTTMRDRGF